MKPASSLLVVSSLCLLSTAKYFSSGWQPGRAVETAQHPAPTFNPQDSSHNSNQKQSSGFDISSLLTSGPLGSLLLKAGFNLSEKVEEVRQKQANIWDNRIPLINDDNYEDMIVNEEMTLQEELERVWFIIVSVTSAQKDGISQAFDEKFDEAYDLTVKANDIKEVKWGRVDYMNVTRITTKWNVWRGPTLLVLSDRGQTLRFLNARYLRPQPELMRKWLAEKLYLELPIWSSPFAPGGKREFVLDYMAIVFQKWYDIATVIPRWAFYLLSGGLASIVIQLLHRGSVKEYAKKHETAATTSGQPTAVTTIDTSSRSSTGKKKSGKK